MDEILVDMDEAKSQLSRLGELAWAGEEVVIAKAGEPYLRLEPYRKPKPDRKPGALKGRIWMTPDFSGTPPDVVDDFYQSRLFPDPEDAR